MNIQRIRAAEHQANKAIEAALSFASEAFVIDPLKDARFILAEVRHFAQCLHATTGEHAELREQAITRLVQAITGE